MSVASLQFVVFVFSALLLYFIVPKKLRWMLLLAASCAYYLLADATCFAFILLTSLTVFFSGLLLRRLNAQRDAALSAAEKEEKKAIRACFKKRRKAVVAVCLILNLGILVFLKYTGFVFSLFGLTLPELGFLSVEGASRYLLPLGISFYTFQAAGYLIDVYNGKLQPEGNYAKFALFVSFFPQIVQGPISRFDQLAGQLYQPHGFDFERVRAGLELMLWGYLKKLVIADSIYPFVVNVVTDWQDYSGTVILAAMLLYSVQLLADFSGGVDISRGICQVIGIELTPNFRQPYFSLSLSEFWRRWHITLGSWFKDYVFFPLATSKLYSRVNQRLRGPMGKVGSDRLCTSLVSLITFVLIGIWHGATWGYVLYGFWHGGLIAIGTMLTDVFSNVKDKLRIKPENPVWKGFQMLRTYLLVLTGFYLVVPLDVADGFGMIQKTFTSQSFVYTQFRTALITARFNRDLPIALCGAAVMLLVAVLSALGRDVRSDLNRAPLPIRWVILLAGIVVLFTFGCYGPGYDATSFIYQVF